MNRISLEALATAVSKVDRMNLREKVALADEIRHSQPQLLALSLIPSRFGVAPSSLEVLIKILLVCYQAMKESHCHWHVITECELERQSRRWIGTVQVADGAGSSADQVRGQYLDQHPERPLLAYALDEINSWLRQRTGEGSAEDQDNVVVMASITLVNCIAHATVSVAS